MAQLNTTAAYVRKPVRTSHVRAFWRTSPDPLQVQILDLLRTPHTVDSLARVVSQGEEDEREADLHRRVAWSMHRLLEVDLIELSPDS